MRDFVVNIEEPTFVFQLPDYVSSLPVDSVGPYVPVMSDSIVLEAPLMTVDEILLLRAVAQEVLDQ